MKNLLTLGLVAFGLTFAMAQETEPKKEETKKECCKTAEKGEKAKCCKTKAKKSEKKACCSAKK